MSNARPFRFGIQVATDPGDIPSREAWITLARKAEDLGYSTFMVADHYVNEYLPIAALMFVADATSTLRVGSCVFDNNYRHPALLAKEVAAIDWLSGGRFELGLGAGALQIDYDHAGLPFDRPGVRIRRLEESVSLIKQFFTQDCVTFAGEYYTVNDLPGFPKPAQRPHPPIFIGGGGKKTLTLAAREANIVGLEHRIKDGDDTFDAFEHSEAALAQKVEFLREAAGERFAAIELNHGIRRIIITEDRQQAAEQRARTGRDRSDTSAGLRRPLLVHWHNRANGGNAATAARTVRNLLSARSISRCRSIRAGGCPPGGSVNYHPICVVKTTSLSS